ncbi:uncharacterized protein LOC132902227 [Amyelois transitella]|uniref:uncharacterized protein LOC132902227 n=1 Tax=Amyelois transitella TaxID=680683 RepID=UPI00298F8817|nr:uncharacterized protein LOC132902227 [Amyelois transitella]
MCNTSEHFQLYTCPAFKSLSPKNRLEFIKSKVGCVNCLSLTHSVSKCNSKYKCRQCGKSHHSLLHLDSSSNKNSPSASFRDSFTKAIIQDSAVSAETGTENCASTSAASMPVISKDREHVSLCARSPDLTNVLPCTTLTCHNRTEVVLSTASIYAYNNEKNIKETVRCLIDNASQNNLITLNCCKKLNLKIIPLSNSTLKGVGLTSRPVIGYAHFTISAKNNKHTFNLTALVIDCITDRLPIDYIDTSIVRHLVNIPLADPFWHIPGEIEIVLGAKLFPFLLLSGKVIAPPAPPAIETVFGFVFMGDAAANTASSVIGDITAIPSSSTASFLTCFEKGIEASLSKFWELEEVPVNKFLSRTDEECEQIYSSTVSRNSSGRYCTVLPFAKDPSSLGNSYTVAHRRLLALERRLSDTDLRVSYNAAIMDYINNKYLDPVLPSDESDGGYIIPHHPVVRLDKQTTKVRVVLDASAQCHNGVSLNDILHTGPNLQADLFLLLLNFRLFPVALTADIRQMYLQILVTEEHQKYQKILFRFDPSEPIRMFKFNRVTFGLRSSPFVAMRTVRQLCNDERSNFPVAAAIAEKELYMDDLASSILNESDAVEASTQLIKMFKSGGFDLVKWSSNSKMVLDNIPLPLRLSQQVEFDKSASLKILGLEWQPESDTFVFKINNDDRSCTKRSILSSIARLWDVLGFAAPVIVYAKLLIKELWLQKVGWDEAPPTNISAMFIKFREQLPLLANLKIPRHLAVAQGSRVNIVAFADASMKAYGCVVFLHVTDPTGNICVRLVCAKSKVAPVKVVSLARLELCAAVIMSKLTKLVYDTYSARTPIDNVYAFSDSKIALSWIHSSPHRWNIFVSNRVAKCHENLEPKNFFHVAGVQNPADCLSRGLLPEQLLTHKLWWNGPEWLITPVLQWPIESFQPEKCEDLPEFNSKTLVATASRGIELSPLCSLSCKVSSWNKLLRIIVYILRFVRLLPRSKRLETSHIITAENYLLRSVQIAHFTHVIKDLKKGNIPSAPLNKLDLFISEDKLIRIGGRLANSNLPFEAKHPILLPKHDNVTYLIIDYFHRVHCHTGAALLSSLIRQKYWIISSRSVIRQRVHNCNFCFKNSPSHPTPKMANLPAFRVQETEAFVHTGVDYAGPINITICRRRGQRSQKAYICLFICLVTKAVHIELASDLSSITFLSAFKRFISRRGPVSHLYSDNGTNFVGAKSHLNELYNFLLSSDYNDLLSSELVNRRIEWHMSPPRAPHFGGIWESNIKSLKTHLYRIIGNQLLTYEELLTVLTQIETIMNSRPLCVLQEEPHLESLTPAHFIMASPLQYLPLTPVSSTPLVTRKSLLDQMIRSYWKRWHLEYLNNLQVRQKWLKDVTNVKIGTVVLIHEDNVPPLRWPLGIIEKTYPGADGTVRVALVKTQNGFLKRPIVKLSPLPSQ